MRPDIEWQVDQPDGDQHTIVHSRPADTSRRHRVIMAVMIILGIALGVAYHAIPEPTPRVAALPQVTPTPVPPPPIDDIIGRESYALAVGNLNAFLALQDPADPNWQRTQLGAFRTWGKPAGGPLYTIVESGTLPANRAWADVLQFRDGEYFRETRFYQLDGGQWRRIAPVTDVDFWGMPQSFQTDHFELRFRTRDLRSRTMSPGNLRASTPASAAIWNVPIGPCRPIKNCKCAYGQIQSRPTFCWSTIRLCMMCSRRAWRACIIKAPHPINRVSIDRSIKRP